MTIADYVIVGAVAAALIFCIVYLFRNRGNSCGGCGGSCNGCNRCKDTDNRYNPKDK